LAFGISVAMLTPAVAGADTLADPASPTGVQGTTVTSSPDFAAFQSGDQETPPNGSPAWSYAVFDVSADGSAITYSARVFGLANPIDAHLHLAPPGVAGPVVVPLDVPGQPGTSGCVDVATGATFERTGTGSGAVSGCASVLPSGTSASGGSSSGFRSADEPCRQLLDGSSATSSATGICGFADISGTITAADLTGPLAGRTMGDLLAAIRSGNIYVNLHTAAFPAGEIRGQLMGSGTGSNTTSTTQTTTSTTSPNTTTTNDSTDSTEAPDYTLY